MTEKNNEIEASAGREASGLMACYLADLEKTMSINFREDMGSEAKSMIEEMFNVEAIDQKTALLGKMDKSFNQHQIGDIARAAKQVATLELNEIGDRKEVGGMAYELDEAGWRRLPVGTKL